MVPLNEARASLYTLVTAARQFLWTVVPLRSPDSSEALEGFVHEAATRALPAFEKKAVLLETLSFLDRHTGSRLPTLVDRFSAECREDRNCLQVFSKCVKDVLRYRGIGHPNVQRAIAMIDERYQDSRFTPRSIGDGLKLRQSSLDVTFKRQTGQKPGDRLREVRLDRAAVLLRTTTKSIKEIWADVGFNDGSTFDHLFRERFGMAPTEYRKRAILPAARTEDGQRHGAGGPSDSAAVKNREVARETILVVDDDESMRLTTGNYLRKQGYDVVLAASSTQALREAQRSSPRVILLDLHMPDIDGLECLDKLRHQRGGQAPIVAILTADRFVDEFENDAHALNATIHSKLCDPETIHQLVRDLTGAGMNSSETV